MKHFTDFTIKSKLTACFSAIVLLMLFMMTITLLSFSSISSYQKEINDISMGNYSDFLNLSINISLTRESIIGMLSNNSQVYVESENKMIKDLEKKNSGIINRVLIRNKKNALLADQSKELESLLAEFNKTRDKQVLPLILNGRIDEARSLVNGIQSERLRKTYDLEYKIISETDKIAKGNMSMLNAIIKWIKVTLFTISCISILLVIMLVLYLNRSIAVPIRKISRLAGEISTGDLTVAISHTKRKDEVGLLGNSIATMVGFFKETMSEVQEALSVMNSSSGSLLVSTAQVAAASSQTASAITETTSTVEEVRQASLLSSKKANSVSENAPKTIQISRQGAESVVKSIDSMKHIKEQTDYIADSIVVLNEQSQTIGDIAAMVTDIADQVNLLSVNASIEAAKAGEYGKGFAVVAQEIKTLAGQAKSATTQVRSILLDIQKAISKAVMATERGSRAVDTGLEQFKGVSETINTLSESVTDALQAAIQIAASSKQQSVGMDQLATAMENIEQASIQNVESSKQVESVSQKLNQLSLKIKDMVAKYKM